MKWLVLIYLFLMSLQDIRHKVLPIWQIKAGAVMAIGYAIWQWRCQSVAWYAPILGFVPGLLLLCLSQITKGQIGCGDGLLLLPIGMMLGIRNTVEMLLWAFLSAGIVAVVLVAIRKRYPVYEIPFVPFLFLGYVLLGGI